MISPTNRTSSSSSAAGHAGGGEGMIGPSGMGRRSTLLIVGDSMSLGAAEILGKDIVGFVTPSYVELLREGLAAVANIVVDAEVHRTTLQALEELPGLLDAHRPDVILLAVGSNDVDVNWKRFIITDGRVGQNTVRMDRYLENVRSIVDFARARGTRVVLMDMHNHNLAVRGPYLSRLAGRDVNAMIERGGGQAASDRGLDEYRAALEALAVETSADLVRYGVMLCGRPPQEVLGEDGVHVNAEGHRLIALELLPVLRRACVESVRPAGHVAASRAVR